MIFWLYHRQIGRKGWRLVVTIPFSDIASAKACASLLKDQLHRSEYPYEFSVREDGTNKHTKV